MTKNNFEKELDEFSDCEGAKGHIPNLFGVFQKGRKRDVSKKDYN
jgi:hypothetical protein